MTANELALELERRVDRESANGSPGYEDYDLSSVLTEAQWLYIKKFVDRLNNRKGEGFEESESRAHGLSQLIKHASCTTSSSQTDVLPNGVFYDLPRDFMFTLAEYVTLNKLHCKTSELITGVVKVIAHNEYQRFRTNPYKMPFANKYEGLVWRMYFSREVSNLNSSLVETVKRHELITDGTFNVVAYVIRYLKTPLSIIVDRDTPNNQQNCELDEFTHDTIVSIAKDLLMERVKEQKLQNIESTKDLE